jgi:hypothetical protein
MARTGAHRASSQLLGKYAPRSCTQPSKSAGQTPGTSGQPAKTAAPTRRLADIGIIGGMGDIITAMNSAEKVISV